MIFCPASAAAAQFRPSPLPEALVRWGVLRPADAAAASVSDLSCSHLVRRVGTPASALVVKFETPDRPGLDRERLVHRLAVHLPPLREVLPPAHLLDERAPLVLGDLDAVPGDLDAVLGDLGSSGPPGDSRTQDPADAAGVLGTMLAGVHRSTAGLPLPRAIEPSLLLLVREWCQGLGSHGHRRLVADLAPDTAAVVAAVARDRALREAVVELGDDTAVCLVHHDLTQRNLWFGRVPGSGVLRGYLLDWELAGLGDPAVDLGWALADLLLADGSGVPRPATRPLSCVSRLLPPSAVALLTAYRDAAGLRPDAVNTLARRTALAATVRVAQTGLELSSHHGPPARERTSGLLREARTLIAEVTGLTEEIAGCLT